MKDVMSPPTCRNATLIRYFAASSAYAEGSHKFSLKFVWGPLTTHVCCGNQHPVSNSKFDFLVSFIIPSFCLSIGSTDIVLRLLEDLVESPQKLSNRFIHYKSPVPQKHLRCGRFIPIVQEKRAIPRAAIGVSVHYKLDCGQNIIPIPHFIHLVNQTSQNLFACLIGSFYQSLSLRVEGCRKPQVGA